MNSTLPTDDALEDGRFQRVRRIIRWIGVLTLTAFLAAWMPLNWMRETSEFLGLDFPESRLTEYLARHLSLLYGMLGIGFVWIAGSRDLTPSHVNLLGIATIAFGTGQAVTDIQSGMPVWWTALESLSTVLGGLFLIGLSKWAQNPHD